MPPQGLLKVEKDSCREIGGEESSETSSVTGFQDERKGCQTQAKECGQPVQNGKGKEMDSLLESTKKEYSPADILILV